MPLVRRVVITGLGLVTPLGVGVDTTWSALVAGKSGVGPITLFDASECSTQIAGEVKGFQAEDFVDPKMARRVELFVAFGVAAAKMALKDARFELTPEVADRVGTSTGCGLGGLELLEKSFETLRLKGPKKATPFFIPMLISNMVAGMISIETGAKGPNFSTSTACAAGNHAIGEAFRMIKYGDAEAMLAGGSEAVISMTCIAGFNGLRALSTRNDEPQKASRPFDQDRDGFVVGEGAGMVFLEEREAAIKRGAHIYAEVIGFGMSGDAFHITAPPPDANGAVRCMQAALKDAGINPQQDGVGYINAHGTSTELNDVYETQAIKEVFGKKAYDIPISSTKSMTGHLLGAAGGIETIFCALAIKNNVIPPTINLDNPGEGCDLDYVPNIARKANVETALNNSFGFGGTNACLILKRHDT